MKAPIVLVTMAALALTGAMAPLRQHPPVRVTIVGNHLLNTFDPATAWGKALDGHEYARTATVYSAANIAAMRSTHLLPTSYRLRTELAIQTWHWNPNGRWSDPSHQQGYWISDPTPRAPILLSWGYRLPRRGRTLDDGNNDGYSRIDDGDTTSFWKSNPYLDPRYTRDPEADHPQWVVVDLGSTQSISTARMSWGDPYPRHFTLEYWAGDQSLPIDRNPDGNWLPFPDGAVRAGHGGTVTLPLGTAPPTRFVRLTLMGSSHTATPGSRDPRDSLGFALRELSLGSVDASGGFHDAMRHGMTAASQSEMLVSSTDPWHRASDLDSDVTQPGIDRVFGSGLSGRQPVMLPTGLLFDTPDNAAAELRYVRARRYPVTRLELGEEPDGQRVTPEDYAALYLQFAAALRRVDSRVTLGGPSLQTTYNDPLRLWPPRNAPGRQESWMGRFVDAIRAHHRLDTFEFFSFEWYPFDDVCGPAAPHVADAPVKLAAAVERLRGAGLPKGIPFVMTEFGYSAHASPAEIDLAGALFNVETVANFFAHGGTSAYAFGVEPTDLMHEPGCEAWGNLAYFLADSAGTVRDTMPAYHAARLLTTAWADSSGGPHRQYATLVSRTGGTGTAPVGAYALQRPDGRWSVLLLNRDSLQTVEVELSLQPGTTVATRPLRGPLELWQYSRSEWQFRQDGASGRPVRSLPPAHRTLTGELPSISLPPMSMTVITGR